MNPIKKKILDLLIYSEIFSYPLTKSEIELAIGESVIHKELLALVAENKIIHQENFYTIFEIGNKIEVRKQGNKKAKEMMPRAMKMAAFISKFPFVEGVGISGSLSKGVLLHDGDFDFFIITTPNRLWVSRTILILYKKIFLLNSRKYFCVNYFIDSEHLAIEERNLFTATEIATLIPVKGEIFTEFYAENQWVLDHRKTRKFRVEEGNTIKKPILTKLIMFLLSNSFGEWLDKKSMQLTFFKWKKKFKMFEHKKFELTMKSRPYVSKHHPQDFQSKVLNHFDNLQILFQKKFPEVNNTSSLDQ